MSYCIDCGDDFRYDDCGGYNPPCECGAHCRSCHEFATRNDDEDDGPVYCGAIDAATDTHCGLYENHPGPHHTGCHGSSCDGCDCVEWSDTPAPAAPEKAQLENSHAENSSVLVEKKGEGA